MMQWKDVTNSDDLTHYFDEHASDEVVLKECYDAALEVFAFADTVEGFVIDSNTGFSQNSDTGVTHHADYLQIQDPNSHRMKGLCLVKEGSKIIRAMSFDENVPTTHHSVQRH